MAAPATAPPTPPITAPCSFLLPGRLSHPDSADKLPAPRTLTRPTDPAAAAVANVRLDIGALLCERRPAEPRPVDAPPPCAPYLHPVQRMGTFNLKAPCPPGA